VFFCQYKDREYYRCSACSLIQLKREHCPSPADEEAEYRLHNNDPYDNGYRKFLSPVTHLMLKWLEKQENTKPYILDFGAGSGPTISVVLEEQGWPVTNYDPIFYPEISTLDKKYDLISSTEVVEHFFVPHKSWKQLFSLRKQNGHVVVMTQCSDAYFTETDFLNWRYIREKSHVAFYHSQTMSWIAKEYGLRLKKLSPNVFWFSP